MSKTKSLLLAVAAAAMGFTVSCSSGGSLEDDGGGGGSSSSGTPQSTVSSSSDGGGVPTPAKTPFTDNRDGKTYNKVTIGTQVWMAENLNYEAEGSKCYDDDPANCAKYGRLYDWETAMSACPVGWHLPSDFSSNSEWSVLENYVGGSSIAGRKLKTTSGWNNCSPSGSNSYYVCEDSYGFSALPGGIGNSDGSFSNVGSGGYWWSASQGTSNSAFYRYTYSYIDALYWQHYSISHLLSVRCLQD